MPLLKWGNNLTCNKDGRAYSMIKLLTKLCMPRILNSFFSVLLTVMLIGCANSANIEQRTDLKLWYDEPA